MTRASRNISAPAGQSSARWLVLGAVRETPKTVAHIARLLCLTRQSVQRVADLLERDGMTEYVPNPDDLRAKVLKVTPGGLAALRKIQSAHRSWADKVGGEIGERPLREAFALLETAAARRCYRLRGARRARGACRARSAL